MPICTRLEWVEEPKLIPCAIGEPADCQGLKIRAFYDDDTEELLDVTQRMLNESNLQTAEPMRKSMIVYSGQKLPVLVPIKEISLDHIEIKAPPKLYGREGEPFERSQVKVIAWYSDDTNRAVENYKVQPGRPFLRDTTELTIRYGCSAGTLPITILPADAPWPTPSAPEELAPTLAADHEPEPMSKPEPDPAPVPKLDSSLPPGNEMPDPSAPARRLPQEGPHALLLAASRGIPPTIGGMQPKAATTSAVPTKEADTPRTLQIVSIAQMPEKLKYQVGETEADLRGGRLNIIYSDGTIEQVDMKADGSVNLACSISGRGCVAFTYSGKPVTYPIEVIAPVVAISLELSRMPYKTIYEQGTLDIDLTGAEVTVRMSDGSSVPVAVTKDMVGPFNFAEIGKSNIFIMHCGFSVLCPIIVVPKSVGPVPQSWPIPASTPPVFVSSVPQPISEAAQPVVKPVGAAIPTPGPSISKPTTMPANHLDMQLGVGSPASEPEPALSSDSGPGAEAAKPAPETGPEPEGAVAPGHEPKAASEPTKSVPDFYVSTFGLRFSIEQDF